MSKPDCNRSEWGCGPMGNRIRGAAILGPLLFVSIAGHAGDWAHMVQACKDAYEGPTRTSVEDCAIKAYGLTPIGPQIGSIAPQGSLGLGLRAKTTIMHPPSLTAKPGTKSKESDLLARGLYSPSNFYLVEGRYDFKMAALGQGNATTSTFEDQIKLSVFARRTNFARQRFFGLGENTLPTNLSEYRQLQDQIGGSADWPIMSWFSAGGTLQWVSPRIKGVSGTSVPSVGAVYDNSGAPGIASQPAFMNYKGYLDAHTGSNTTQTW